jgi:hypothetical protein
MDTGNDNPYQSPVASDLAGVEPPVSRQNRTSIPRGLAYALPLGLLGSILPFAVFSTRALMGWMLGSYLWIDVIDDFQQMPSTLVDACVGCALVFALAAIANYTPARRAGLLRSISLVGLSAVVALFFVAIGSAVFDLGPRSYTSDPWLWARIGLAASIVCGFGVALTGMRIVLQHGPSNSA